MELKPVAESHPALSHPQRAFSLPPLKQAGLKNLNSHSRNTVRQQSALHLADVWSGTPDSRMNLVDHHQLLMCQVRVPKKNSKAWNSNRVRIHLQAALIFIISSYTNFKVTV